MNCEMAYLLGMICGNGSIQRGNRDTSISIEIPHKKLTTESNNNVRVYVQASITNIRDKIEPLIGSNASFTQSPNTSYLCITLSNDNYVMREIFRSFKNRTSQDNFNIPEDIVSSTPVDKFSFLKGLSDVTAYIRRSNYFFNDYMHRVYIEIPQNWGLVIDICNLLKSVDIPVQTIDWAHPNIRDGKLTKYKQGYKNFWKKEHQIKVFANEFLPVGFAVIHKHQALRDLSKELISGLKTNNRNLESTHNYYWETRNTNTIKPVHPCENDLFIPQEIRGIHFNSWKEIADRLGYKR